MAVQSCRVLGQKQQVNTIGGKNGLAQNQEYKTSENYDNNFFKIGNEIK